MDLIWTAYVVDMHPIMSVGVIPILPAMSPPKGAIPAPVTALPKDTKIQSL